jgi:hypothetical protein
MFHRFKQIWLVLLSAAVLLTVGQCVLAPHAAFSQQVVSVDSLRQSLLGGGTDKGTDAPDEVGESARPVREAPSSERAPAGRQQERERNREPAADSEANAVGTPVRAPSAEMGAATSAESDEHVDRRSGSGGFQWYAPPVNAGNWEFGFGPAVRTGGSVKFFSRALLRPDGGQFVNGLHTGAGDFLIEGDANDPGDEKVSPQLDVAGWQETDPNGNPLTAADNNGDEWYTRNVTFDQSTFHGADADFDPYLGVTLEAGRSLEKNPLFLSNIAVGLGILQNSAETSARSGRGITTNTLSGILYKQGGTKPPNTQPLTPFQKQEGALKQGGPSFAMTEELFDFGAPATTDVRVGLDADSTLFTLSLGLEHDIAITDWLRLFVGIGPTLNMGYLETVVSQSARWDAPGNPLDGKKVQHFADEESDSELSFMAGVFGSIGLRVQLVDRIAVDLGCRLDRIFGDMKTDHAEMDFETSLSLEARLIMTF